MTRIPVWNIGLINFLVSASPRYLLENKNLILLSTLCIFATYHFNVFSLLLHQHHQHQHLHNHHHSTTPPPSPHLSSSLFLRKKCFAYSKCNSTQQKRVREKIYITSFSLPSDSMFGWLSSCTNLNFIRCFILKLLAKID